jgi:hypothetical protein
MNPYRRNHIPSCRRLGAVLVGASALLAACGDDGDGAKSSTSSVAAGVDDAVPEYCILIEEIGDALPTDEQFEQILAVAPDEIADNLAVVVAAFRADPDGAFSDPAVAENFPAIQAYESTICGGEAPAEIDPDAQLVAVAASEYSFDLVTAPQAGAVSFVITNEGAEIHEMLLARLVGDTTVDEAIAAEDAEAEGLAEAVGFAGPILAGTQAVLNADLTSGRYALVCFVPAPDGTPHVHKGMVTEFTVD